MTKDTSALCVELAERENEPWLADWADPIRNRVQDEAAIEGGCWFDPVEAVRVVRFCRMLRLPDSKIAKPGELAPFELRAWQRDKIMVPLFAWKRADGTRRFRRSGIWVAKKNGKSALGSAIELYMLLADREPNAEVYAAANDSNQAGITYRDAAKMIKSSPDLSPLCKVHEATNNRQIVYVSGDSESILRPLSKDGKVNEGLKAHCIVFDEIHALRSPELWDSLAFAGAARSQPLLVSLSTAGANMDGIGYEQYDYAVRVRDGDIVDWEFLAVVFEVPKDADWTDESFWHLANPNLGVSIDMDEMRAARDEAIASPRKESVFRRYRLNQWTGAESPWLPSEAWRACAGPVPWQKLRDQYAGMPGSVAAFDLGFTNDWTALVTMWLPDDDDKPAVVIPRFWIPQTAAQDLMERTALPILAWQREGAVTVTDGNIADFPRIEREMLAEMERFSVGPVACDQYGGRDFAQRLDAGHGGDVVAYPQNAPAMNGPAREFERRVISGRLIHGGHPVLAWMAGNAVVKEDTNGNIKPLKQGGKDSLAKIDGIVAAVMAAGMAIKMRGTGPGVYEQQGRGVMLW